MRTGISVMDAMTQNPVTVSPQISIKDCAKKMQEYNIGSLIVQHEGYIAGIITEQDVVCRVVASSKNVETTPAKDIMTTSVITISPDADLYDAMVKMRDSGVRHLPVCDGPQLIGFLTLKDILKIEPDLFDLIATHIELREEERKPINARYASTETAELPVCENCGTYSDTLSEMYGARLCEECRDISVTIKDDE